MNEQQIEALERLFPRGFTVIGLMPNGHYHVYLNNPERDIVIDSAHDDLTEQIGLEALDEADESPTRAHDT